ncbi:Adenylate cyclase type 10 [Phlyctochytrium planicorne]|nr:Adenylate cyclase type 10 [Phlyctochytrium planicorne]
MTREIKTSWKQPFQTISKTLIQDVEEKSQGNPMALKLICGFLVSNQLLLVKNETLHLKRAVNDTETFDIDISSAVNSQIDRFEPDLRLILRVASVAGQFFTLSEVAFSLEAVNSENSISERVESTFVENALEIAVKHGILRVSADHESASDSRKQYSFQHYLIYQAIYQSQLPAWREKVHRAYADHYESVLTTTQTRQCVSNLLYHLLKLPDEHERKRKYVRAAFLMFGDRFRPVEGFEYYHILQSLTEGEKQSCLEEAQELRILGQLYSEKQSIEKAAIHLTKALRVLGLAVNKDSVVVQMKTLVKFLACSRQLEKILSMDVPRRFLSALAILKSIFKRAFAHVNIKSVALYFDRQAISPDGDGADELQGVMQDIHKIIEEIHALMNTVIYFFVFYGDSGIEYALYQCIDVLLKCMRSTSQQDELIGAGYGTVAYLLSLTGNVKDSDRVLNIATKMVDEAETDEITVEGTLFLAMVAMVTNLHCSWERSSWAARTAISRLEELGRLSTEKFQTLHLGDTALAITLGKYEYALERSRYAISTLYHESMHLFEASEVAITFSALLTAQGGLEEGLLYYIRHAQTIEEKLKVEMIL